jgi:hypothetical protein
VPNSQHLINDEQEPLASQGKAEHLARQSDAYTVLALHAAIPTNRLCPLRKVCVTKRSRHPVTPTILDMPTNSVVD